MQTPENFGIYSQRDRKSKTWFLTFLSVYISWFEWMGKILISQLSPPNLGILQTRMDQKGDPMKMNFDNFQMQTWVSWKVRAPKADEKNRVICLVFMSPSWVIVNFCWCQKKSKAVIATYVYASESSRFALSENGIGYYAIT